MLNDGSKITEQILLEQITAIGLQLKQTQHFSKAPDKLSLLVALSQSPHPCVFPDSIMIRRAIDMLREEKFSLTRESQGDSADISYIQDAINKLKKLKRKAEFMHPPVAMQCNWGVSLEGAVFWAFWLFLQIVTIILCGLIYPSPNTSITCLTVANVILLLMSFACKSLVGLIITSTQIAGYFIAMAIVYFMHI